MCFGRTKRRICNRKRGSGERTDRDRRWCQRFVRTMSRHCRRVFRLGTFVQCQRRLWEEESIVEETTMSIRQRADALRYGTMVFEQCCSSNIDTKKDFGPAQFHRAVRSNSSRLKQNACKNNV